jgi:transposase-like protein
MARVKALTDRTIAERFAEIKTEEQLWGEISTETRQLAARIMSAALEDELQHRLHASRYKRTEVRQGYRNGGYWRTVASRWGVLDVFQPRARIAQPPSQVLGRFRRRETEVDALIRQAFLRGISTRQVGAVLEPVLGWRPSAQTVSTIAQALDQEVQRYHWRRVDDDWVYLLLDGVTMKVKHPGGKKTKLVLVAYGIRADGTRQLIDFTLAKSESQAEWERFLEDLHRRGLEGTGLRLIATDGGTGLGAAIGIVYPKAPHQRCWAHKLRNVAAVLPRTIQTECLAGAKQIYLAANARQAGQRFRAWKKQWQDRAPKAVACLERDLEELLTFYACPEADWRKTRTTNAIERCFREVRRRTRPMSCFTNTASCERIIYAVLHHLNASWSLVPSRQSTQAS